MVLNQVSPDPIQEHHSSMLYSATTPPESTIDDLDPLHNVNPGSNHSGTSVPWPGRTFIIRSTSCGRVLTLSDGRVVLTRSNSSNDTSAHWVCTEERGWIGFRNIASGKFLGHNWDGEVVCVGVRQQGWEYFVVRQRPEGDYVLMLTHHNELWYVNVERVRGIERIGKLGPGGARGMGWEFVEVGDV